MNKTGDPSQATDDLDSLLGHVVDNYLQRLAGGERVEWEQYALDHPEIATLIRQTFPLLSMIRDSSAEVALGDKLDLSSSRRLGDFQLLHELGSGGMGFVYEAEQLSMGRRVALKILPLAGALQQKSLQRFRNEVRAAAMLDHPHIVSVYSIGEERGVHYYAMQLIHGQTLADVIERLSQPLFSESPLNGNTISRILRADPPVPPTSGMESTCEFNPENDDRYAAGLLTTRAGVKDGIGTTASLTPTSDFFRSVAELGVQGAEALQHAHEQGVIHRDIKPGNLMLDAQAQLYVTDFGLARIETDTRVTMTGDLLGTLRYMSPEQTLGKGVVVDHRSDIYSLGVTLYELLALRPAFDGSNRQELLNQIALDDPPQLRKVNRFVPRELETIIHKAIAKRPDDRYLTAQDFAEDLKCFLLDRPIKAKPASRFDQARKWARRHKEMVAAVGATLMVAAVVAGFVLWKERSDTFAALASRTAALADRDRALAQAKRQADIAHRVNQQSQTLLYAADIKLAADAIANSDVPRAAELLQRHIPGADNEDRRGFEWYYFHKQISSPLSVELQQGDWVNDVAISPDGRWLAATAAQGTVKIYEMETWKRHASLPTMTTSVNGLAWSPDGNLLAAACADGRLVVAGFPPGTEGSFTIASHDGEANDVIFSPDGRTLYSCGYDHLAKSWDVETGTLRQEFRGHGREVERIALAPDGRWLATASSDGSFAIWDAESGTRKHQWDFPTGRMVCVAFSPDGRQLAAGTIYGQLYVADTTTGTWELLAKLLDGIEALTFFDAGRLLATADRGGALQLHSLTDAAASDSSHINEPSRRWVGHEDRAVALTATADGKGLVSGGRDGAIRAWMPDLQATHWFLADDPHRSDLTVGVNHRLYAAGPTISIWNLESRRLVDSFGSTDPPWQLVEASADGRYLAAARIGQIALFDLDSHRMIESWNIDDQLDPYRLAISHSGRWIAFTDYTDRESVMVYQRDGSRSVRTFPARQCECLAFSPDERFLAAGHQNDLRLFELHADREPRVLEGHSSTLSGSAFHPTGQLLATVGHDRILKVYRVATGELLYSIVAHRDWVRSVAFSPDGKTIATASYSDPVRLWHTATGQPLGSLLPNAGNMKKLVFDPAGLRLVAFPHHQPAQTVVYDAYVSPSGPDPNSRGSRVPQTAIDRSGSVSP
jgi:eukaryotic-like serine/threonine-protein kinase